MRLALCIAALWLASGFAWAAPPNVLLIIADDQGLEMGCYGNSHIQTPNLDALAARGTRFDLGFATVSSCSSSRSVMFTGLYSHQNGVYGLAHDVHNAHFLDGIVTLPVRLKKAGYWTALVGKKHLKPDSARDFDQELAAEESGNRDVVRLSRAAGSVMRSAHRPFFVAVRYSDPHRAPQNFGNTQDWPEIKRRRYSPAEVVVPRQPGYWVVGIGKKHAEAHRRDVAKKTYES